MESAKELYLFQYVFFEPTAVKEQNIQELIPYIRFFYACQKICETRGKSVTFLICIRHCLRFKKFVMEMIRDIIPAYSINCDLKEKCENQIIAKITGYTVSNAI